MNLCLGQCGQVESFSVLVKRFWTCFEIISKRSIMPVLHCGSCHLQMRTSVHPGSPDTRAAFAATAQQEWHMSRRTKS